MVGPLLRARIRVHAEPIPVTPCTSPALSAGIHTRDALALGPMSPLPTASARALRPPRLLAATLLAAVAAAALFAASPRAAVIGVNEDETKTNTSLYSQIAAAGLKQNVLSVTWQQGSGLSSGQQSVIRSAISAGQAQGVKIVLAIYPAVGQASRFGDPSNKAEFISFVTNTLKSFPQVKDVVIGNEPNRTLFMSPVNPAYFAELLGDAYDAVKAVDPSIKVLGAGLSPRGTGDSRSLFPPQFIKGMGDWYRTSDRAKAGKPLMDTFSFHPYPFPENKAPDVASDWPTIGMADLDRLKQALHDAFVGTPQKTPANGLTIDLDELAYQVPTQGKSGYTGIETVETVSEATQATYYGQIIRQVACDPVISSLSFFHFIDEAARDRFQSGLLDVQGNPRSFLIAAVKDAIAATDGGTKCTGTPNTWKPTTGIFGGIIDLSAVKPTAPQTISSLKALVRVEENVKATIGLFQIAGATPTAAETAEIRKLLAGETVARGTVKTVEVDSRNIPAGAILRKDQRAELPLKLNGVPTGRHVLGVLLVSENAPSRTMTSLSTSIAIGAVADLNARITITGERTKVGKSAGIKITGDSTGLPAGTVLVPWVRFPGQTEFAKGTARITVAADGTFTWTRKTGKRVNVYLATDDGDVKSNRISIPAA